MLRNHTITQRRRGNPQIRTPRPSSPRCVAGRGGWRRTLAKGRAMTGIPSGITPMPRR